ncbi:MAG: DUF1326 domain-containing protein [Acidobacteria bacterium]|nr:DUF1326 domain-containing protein [Acidobacteriota bacterium]MBV9623767.1 DUF1326 domain-containing protein [Acidobacteriota bacterium]
MSREWRFKAEYIKNCNCAPGCPCDFWASPTHYKCEGMMAFNILNGNFADTKLDGAIAGATYHWDGPLHLGGGTIQPFLSDNTSAGQRDALLTIMSGKAGGTWFEVLASVVSTVLEPKFVPIEFSFDLKARRATVKFGDEMETRTQPIKNVATGDEHRILVDMPSGMEYRHPEIATAAIVRSSGALKFDLSGSHSSMAIVEHTDKALIA